MTKAIQSRLARLEQSTRFQAPIILHCGWLSAKLPDGYTGPRETVMVSCEPTRSEHIFWCEFEERAVEATVSVKKKDRGA